MGCWDEAGLRMKEVDGLPVGQHWAPPLPHPLQCREQKIGQHPAALLGEVQPVREVPAPPVFLHGTQLTHFEMEVHQLQTKGPRHHADPQSVLLCKLVLSVQLPPLLLAVASPVLQGMTAIMRWTEEGGPGCGDLQLQTLPNGRYYSIYIGTLRTQTMGHTLPNDIHLRI